MQRMNDLPVWIWLWLVLAPLIVQLVAFTLLQDSSVYVAIFEGEFGAVEILTALVLLPAAIAAVVSARHFLGRNAPVEAAFLVAFALGCIFLFGEEVSWGQHLFNWSSPDYFQQHNLQSETNLHNLKYFNKGLLKWLVVIGILIGGILIPHWAKIKSARLNPEEHRFIWLLPTYVCTPAATIVVVTHFLAKAAVSLGLGSFYDLTGFVAAEVTELYIAIFCLIYALSILSRLQQAIKRQTIEETRRVHPGVVCDVD